MVNDSLSESDLKSDKCIIKESKDEVSKQFFQYLFYIFNVFNENIGSRFYSFSTCYAVSDVIDEDLINKALSSFKYNEHIVSSFTNHDLVTLKHDVTAMNELDEARNKLIDDELKRTEEYKNFLLSLKK